MSAPFPMTVKDWGGEDSSREKKRKRLSLCMIVKNEEKFLPQCLESVKDVVDEMVIVDTGSTDKTVEIAKNFGARVFHFPWIGDFAAARNVSLDHASGDWVLVLDADEVLSPDDKGLVRQLIERDETVGFMVRIQNIMEDAERPDYMEHFYVRLFPVHPDIRYIGAIHEQVMHRIKGSEGQMVYLPVDRILTMATLYHYGYTGQAFVERNKSDRNKRILENILSQDQKNGFHHFNLGIMHLVDREWEKAYEEFKHARRYVNQRISYYPMILICGANALVPQGRHEEAVEWAREAVSLLPEMPDGYYTLGTALESSGQFVEAIKTYLEAISKGKEEATYVIHDPSTATWKPYHQIGMCWLKMKKPEEAVEAFEKAVALKPKTLMLLQNLAQTHLCLDHFERAEKVFLEILSLDFQQGFTSLVDLYRKQKRFDDLLVLAYSVVGTDPSRAEIWGGLGFVFLQEGELRRAHEAFRELLSHQESSACHNNIGAVALQLGDLEEAQAHFEKALKLNPEHVEARINHARSLLLLGRAEEAYRELEGFSASVQHAEQAVHFQAQAAIRWLSLDDILKKKQGDFRFLRTLGSVLAEEGRRGEAFAIYERLLKESPPDPMTYFRLGALLLQTKEYPRALEVFKKALVLNPRMQEAEVGIRAAETLVSLQDSLG